MTNLNFRDVVRLALYFVMPIYARIYPFLSIWTAFGHAFVLGTTGISIVHLSDRKIGLNTVWDLVYGLLVCSFPSWGPRIVGMTWFGNNEGWLWEVLYWMLVARRLAYFLPKEYGSDIEALRKAPQQPCPCSQILIVTLSGAIVFFISWLVGSTWHGAACMYFIINSLLQHACLTYLNHIYLQKFGKSAFEAEEDASARGDRYIYESIFGALHDPGMHRT